MPSKTLVANWKMTSSLAKGLEYFEDLSTLLKKSSKENALSSEDFPRLVFCPSFPYLLPIQGRLLEHGFALGAQDCSPQAKGAHTGDVSAAMLRDVGCSYVLIGHSERRQTHHETDSICQEKLSQAHESGLTAIYCLGETLEDRDKGRLEHVLAQQLSQGLSPTVTTDNTVIAYEPVWAIGTGKTPSLEDIQHTHRLIASLIQQHTKAPGLPILYGGSVNPRNAHDILALPEVKGALIGGASQDPQSMMEIIQAAASQHKRAA